MRLKLDFIAIAILCLMTMAIPLYTKLSSVDLFVMERLGFPSKYMLNLSSSKCFRHVASGYYGVLFDVLRHSIIWFTPSIILELVLAPIVFSYITFANIEFGIDRALHVVPATIRRIAMHRLIYGTILVSIPIVVGTFFALELIIPAKEVALIFIYIPIPLSLVLTSSLLSFILCLLLRRSMYGAIISSIVAIIAFLSLRDTIIVAFSEASMSRTPIPKVLLIDLYLFIPVAILLALSIYMIRRGIEL